MSARPVADTLTVIFEALGEVSGRSVLDAGCGHGRLAAALLGRGAGVAAVDPDAAAVSAARTAAPAARVEQASAEALPFPDASFDGVVMLNSLHHVPVASQAGALAEMGRVAKPGAPVVIVEPLAEGSFFAAMRPVEDETEARAEAQAAIATACAEGGPLRLMETLEYERLNAFPDVEAFLRALVSADPAREIALAGARADVERLVAEHGEPVANGFALRQPHRMHQLVKRS
ncbi:class I SAM-dependent methyltransferase [Chenggangzhangella methanolivorans]|uniref:Class I SAM-dependent methyltransferase n=1 Tax=Chenggangzhangella methanolivorans TaxID=1437009 RepID=A0A9E6UKS5_9HYPH|nr:class I SAM-dependent methyltransferase [Chenggangzhangella methanolivorans]QZN99731.1 class I SAM-dependent methyltransferase [Chenggangzhangella methanolivorans]